MNTKLILAALCTLTPFRDISAAGNTPDSTHHLGNSNISRSLIIQDGRLFTGEIHNKQSGKTLRPGTRDEFRIRISEGTDKPGTAAVLTAADFESTHTSTHGTEAQGRRGEMFTLKNAEHGLEVKVHYELNDGDFYMRKWLEITSARPVTLERIDVEVMALEDALQPNRHNDISARRKAGWRPGLGQPLYTTESATFWGMEFPAAHNYVRDGLLVCGYHWGWEIAAGETYRTHPAVVGVADDPAFLSDAFYDYINRIRIRPHRLQVQYNSWFDFNRNVSHEGFVKSVETLHAELVEKRGVPNFRAYVVDDGWQVLEPGLADITRQAWPVNDKFDADFAGTHAAVRRVGSSLGLWLSPACLFGASHMVKTYGEAGFESLTAGMSMSGPKYMALLEERLVELTRQGVTYFKFDGLFGHLNIRMFELQGRGAPAMPQLNVEGLAPHNERLNDPVYDELKTYYLVAGTERLMRIFQRLHEINPGIYLNITNGAYLSPWWLQHVDAVWMINAGDGGGTGTKGRLTYRDGVYYEIWEEENVQFPMSSLYNHEPAQRFSSEDRPHVYDNMREYLHMCFSRGTGLIQMYIRPRNFRDSDWDTWAEALHWVHRNYPAFLRARRHGGDPRRAEVYGYTGWNESRGYISLFNPGEEEQTYTVTLNRAFGLLPGSGPFQVSASLGDRPAGLADTLAYGDTLTSVLRPREVRILEFTK